MVRACTMWVRTVAIGRVRMAAVMALTTCTSTRVLSIRRLAAAAATGTVSVSVQKFLANESKAKLA